jgi:hypothetical protein
VTFLKHKKNTLSLNQPEEIMPTYSDSTYVGASTLLPVIGTMRANVQYRVDGLLEYDDESQGNLDPNIATRGIFAAFRGGQWLVWSMVRGVNELYVAQHATQGGRLAETDWRQGGCSETLLTPTGLGEAHWQSSGIRVTSDPRRSGTAPYDTLERTVNYIDNEPHVLIGADAVPQLQRVVDEGHNVWQHPLVSDMLETVYGIVPPWRQ